MHVLTVAYGHPADPAAFDRYYETTHRPLVDKVPGLLDFTARHCVPVDDGDSPYYLLAQLSFASAESLASGRGSPEGQAAAADIKNFADGGVTLFVQHD